MLVFHTVKYQNFLASGNVPITIDLAKHQTTLIVGKNGTGKSTLAEAICFGAFGRPLRNINKPQLVNSVNQHDCLVELTFTAQNTTYMVRRGIKPSVFEIYADGNLIPSPAAVADYQTLLETQILRLNYKSFMQVVVLGSSTYVPFMRLTASARRDIIEDLLDIEVFSSMNALAKDDAQEVKTEFDKANQAQQLVTQQVKMAQQFTDAVKEQREQAVANVEQAIATVRIGLEDHEQDLVELQEKLTTYDEVQDAYACAQDKLTQYQHTLIAIESKEKKLRKERTFYEDHDTCPTCEQPIDTTFKSDRYTMLESKEQEALRAIAECRRLVGKYDGRTSELQAKLDEGKVLQREIDRVSTKIPLYTHRLGELERELAAHQAPKQGVEVDINALETQLDDLHSKSEALSKRRVIIDAAGMLLRDNGIKTRIIRHYIPIINRTINHYLTQMDFPVQFTLDEEFQEHLKSRYRDDFAYESFSEGEKKRIDLALLLTWRTVAALKNSAATNLLILDEVFDSSLDLSGTEEFMKIIAGLEKETNVFIISHKTDQLVDKFAHSITFEKTRGFSQVKV